MKKAYIQPEFDLLKLSSTEDILFSVDTKSEGVSWGNDSDVDNDSGLKEDFGDWT